MSRSLVSGSRLKPYFVAKQPDIKVMDMQSLTEDSITWDAAANGTLSAVTAAPYSDGVSQGVLKLVADNATGDCWSFHQFGVANHKDWSGFSGLGFSVYFDKSDSDQFVQLLVRDGAAGTAGDGQTRVRPQTCHRGDRRLRHARAASTAEHRAHPARAAV